MLTCRNLNQLPSLQTLTCVAGKKGLNHIIRWPYIAESRTFAQWIHGGELLIISGALSQNPNFDLTAIINEAIKARLSGALLLCGSQYITAIPSEAAAAADDAAFPLMKISWNVPLVDILEEIGRAILDANSIAQQAEDILHNILFAEYSQTEFIIEQASLLNYDLTRHQQILLVYFSAANSDKKTLPLRETIREFLHTLLTKAALPHLISSYHNHLIILFSPEKDNDISALLPDLQTTLRKELPQLTFYIGAGGIYTSLSKLKTSFKEASQAVSLLVRLKQNNSFCLFSDVGLYGLLSRLNKTTVLKPFTDQTLGRPEEYDRTNNCQLSETLAVYLENNCSLSQTAQTLAVHRNTLKYRLSRIEQISGKNLSTATGRLELQTALFIRQMIL